MPSLPVQMAGVTHLATAHSTASIALPMQTIPGPDLTSMIVLGLLVSIKSKVLPESGLVISLHCLS